MQYNTELRQYGGMIRRNKISGINGWSNGIMVSWDKDILIFLNIALWTHFNEMKLPIPFSITLP